MKNDTLLKGLVQKGLKAQFSNGEKSSISQILTPLDSGQLINVKGGNDTDPPARIIITN